MSLVQIEQVKKVCLSCGIDHWEGIPEWIQKFYKSQHRSSEWLNIHIFTKRIFVPLQATPLTVRGTSD